MSRVIHELQRIERGCVTTHGAMDVDAQKPRRVDSASPYVRDWLRALPPRWLFRLLTWLKVKPPPMKAIMDAGSFMLPQWMYVSARLNVPELLAEKPRTTQMLAELTQINPDRLGRLLYALEQQGYFRRLTVDANNPLNGPWSNTATSATLLASHPNTIRPILFHWVEDCYRPAGELFESLRKNECAFALENAPNYNSFFEDYLPSHPGKSKQFAEAMTASSAFSDQAVLSDFNWSRFSRIIDAGGSNGSFLEKALTRHSSIQGVLFDLPNVIESVPVGDGFTAPNGESRIKLVAGDFFEPDTIPSITDGEAVVLRNVLHDWSDDKCIDILKNLRASMSPGARLVLVEVGLASNSGGHVLEQARSSLDMLMMTMFDGKERTCAALSELVETSGFDVVSFQATRSLFQVLEASPRV